MVEEASQWTHNQNPIETISPKVPKHAVLKKILLADDNYDMR
jgi:hypothetical protein